MFGRISLLILLFGVGKISLDLIDVETCIHNFDKISVAYWYNVRTYILIVKFLNHANHSLIEEVENLNADVYEGPGKCRKFALDERADYIDVMYEICASSQPDDWQADPKVLTDFKAVPHEFLQSNNKDTRELYCPVTVQYLNTVSRLRNMVQDIVDSLKKCHYLDRFETQFRRPWADCAESY